MKIKPIQAMPFHQTKVLVAFKNRLLISNEYLQKSNNLNQLTFIDFVITDSFLLKF